ncbi:MAG: YigZ family protein [Gemmatimonadota bacterium]
MADPTRYPIPARAHRVEGGVLRSRFITSAAHAPDAEAAHAIIDRIRSEMPDATHHCWAFVAGPPGSTAQIGMSDAGEPHGTAGRPMLSTLLHGGVGEIVVVCSRYFGGTKLGTGGLARAYADGVKQVLASLPTVEKVERVRVSVRLVYGEVDAVLRIARELGALVEGEEYGSDVRYLLAVPVGELAVLEAAVAEITQGRGKVERT